MKNERQLLPTRVYLIFDTKVVIPARRELHYVELDLSNTRKPD